MLLLSSFEYLTLGGVYLGVKNDSKNFEDKKKHFAPLESKEKQTELSNSHMTMVMMLTTMCCTVQMTFHCSLFYACI